MTVHSATALGNQHRPAVGCLVSEQSAACQEVTLGLESTAIPSRGRDRWRMPRVAIGPRARGSWSRHRHRECGQSTRLTRDCPRPTGRRPRAAAELRSQPQDCSRISGQTLHRYQPQWSRCLPPRLVPRLRVDHLGQDQPPIWAVVIARTKRKMMIFSHSRQLHRPIQAMSAGHERGSSGSRSRDVMPKA